MAKKPKERKPARPAGKKPAAPPAADAPPADAPPVDFDEVVPIVGIGASAGGLDAFKKFFTAMPAKSGVAFVLIPHLDPKHESLMVELLSRHTKMPVTEAKDGMAVEADRVYIIPPNKYMTILGGVLRLSGPVERGGSQTSIDIFLRCLADDRRERAICIILSGTGAHGSLGLKAIKAAGGMAMVQDPSTAEYPRMPENAIATGLADYVLPPEEMPKAIVQYVQHSYVNGGQRRPPEQASDELNQLLALLRVRAKFDFRCYRKKMLMRRIERRMSLSHFEHLTDYIAHLRDHPEEIRHLARDLLISVTSFFRDPEALETLARDAIAPLVRGKHPDAPLRIWVPGCATGEEAYTLAMLVLEELTRARQTCPLQIFASDVDEGALKTARDGAYPESISADVSPERLAHFFTKAEDGGYRVNKQMRESVVFAEHNLIADAPFSRIDIVSCRNMLIYLEPGVQAKVLALFHFALNDGGYLLLGPSETIGRHVDLFEPVSKKWRIFRRIGPSRPERVEFPIGGFAETPAPVRRAPGSSRERPISFAEVSQRLLMEELAPAAVLINRKYEALYFLGPITRYLDVPAGEPTQDVLMMAREGMRTQLRGAIHRAVEEGQPVRLGDVQVRRNGGYQRVVVAVKPVLVPKNAEGLLLIVFQDVLEREPGSRSEAAAENKLVRQLEYELRATKEDLQGTIEEMESGNEELKASNEEVMSMNEELQSANEELETSKEELQSLNEELLSVNNQLHEKVDQLEAAQNDIANLLNCTDIATVFLDADLCIRRFTPAATRVLNVVATDIGRPIGEIKLKFADAELLTDAERVLRELTPREHEVVTQDKRACIRRITPFRTAENRIDGVVLTFIDVTALKESAARAHLLATVLLNSNDANIVHDLDGRITAWNRGAQNLYGYTEAEALSMNIMQIVPEKLRADYQAALDRLKRGDTIDSWEAQRIVKGGRIVDVWITATALHDESGLVFAIAKTDRDITEQKRARASLEGEVVRRTADLHEKEARLQAILNAPRDAIITLDKAGIIESFNPAAESLFGYPAAELIGKNVNLLVPDPDRDEPANFIKRYLEPGEAHPGSVSREVQARRKDGTLFWGDLAIAEVKGRKLFTAVLRDISRRKELEREVVEISALEQERIGQGLHDEIGQEVTALGLLAGALADSLQGAPASAELARKLGVGLSAVLRQLRNIAQGLALSEVKKAELPNALRELAGRLEESSSMRLHFRASPSAAVASDLQATHVYHIGQEACTNALKHARAENIDISLRTDDNSVILEVRDDGLGIPEETKNGLGLRIMRNRAAVIGAALAIRRAEPKGTIVTCTLPKEPRHGRK